MNDCTGKNRRPDGPTCTDRDNACRMPAIPTKACWWRERYGRHHGNYLAAIASHAAEKGGGG